MNEPYWIEWADDSGDPARNELGTFATPAELVAGLAGLLNQLGHADHAAAQLGYRPLPDLAAALKPGQQHELDLPTGRLYFGLAQ